MKQQQAENATDVTVWKITVNIFTQTVRYMMYT